jgi:hypothetical protein
MRKRYRVLVLAALVAALIVPVGFALSLESPAPLMRVSSAALDAPAAGLPWTVPGSAKLFIVGTVLFGLAAFVRRAV